jgi:phage gp36-like protein
MTTDQQEKLIRRYLLGELPEAEQTAFERELLADREKFDRVWATESRLVDSYVRGEVSRSDRERFEGHYLASPLHRERVAIAELFLQDLDEKTAEVPAAVRQAAPAVSWWSQLFAPMHRPQLPFGAAVAILLLLSCGAGWLYLERTRLTEQLVKLQEEAQAERSSRRQREQELARRAQEAEKENAGRQQDNEQLNAELEQFRRLRRQPGPPALLSFLLTPAPTRGQNVPPPQIPLVTSPVRLLMELNGSHYPSYRFRLQTVEGREIFSQSGGSGSGKDRAFATVTVPAGKLAKGDYVLILSGRTAAGAVEEIDQYFFQVK